MKQQMTELQDALQDKDLQVTRLDNELRDSKRVIAKLEESNSEL